MTSAETIVAVATPAGRSPRAVLRLSGPDSLPCAEARFRPQGSAGELWRRTFRATPGRLRLLGEGLEVPAVLYVMRAPHSYTRQDVVEAHLPGSPPLLEMALDDVLQHGPGHVRPAEPGEFTRLAFLNGRIDLTQAEAVLSLIRARNESELLAAAEKLKGKVGRRTRELQEAVTNLRVQAEAALDFSPHGIELMGEGEFVERSRRLCRRMEAEVARGRGELAADGAIHAVICGPPNAGKSSLLNRLVEREAALVHHRAGTTRDAVRGRVEIGGVRFRMTDTAGLGRRVPGPDAEAADRARREAAHCQLLILVLDGSRPLPEGAAEPAELLPPERVLCVINKCDLPEELDEKRLAPESFAWETLHTSALTGEGLQGLRDALGRTVAEGRLDASAADCLFNARQRRAVRTALEGVRRAAAAAEQGMGYEFAAVDLRAASEALGQVTGRVGAQDVLDAIFSQFCIGK